MISKSFAMRAASTLAGLLVAYGATAFDAHPAAAAEYPTQPIRIMVGFAAGGAPDTLARVVGDRLAAEWGQPVVVENRIGAQGNIAMTMVARAAADGYTLALMPIGNAAINPSLMPSMPYDPVKDFAPITQIATVENVLVIGAQSRIHTLKELIALGRSKRVNLSYATPGAGSLAHLAAELMARAAGFQLNHVP
jgi:tripartite-type tricarboxylate transporter receptor subunit TctC